MWTTQGGIEEHFAISDDRFTTYRKLENQKGTE